MTPNRPRCPTCGADKWEPTNETIDLLIHMPYETDRLLSQTKEGLTQLILKVRCLDCGQRYETAWSFFAQIDGGRIG